MRRGGTAIALRDLTIWCMILTVIGFMIVAKINDIKKNYTEIHRRVSDLERISK